MPSVAMDASSMEFIDSVEGARKIMMQSVKKEMLPTEQKSILASSRYHQQGMLRSHKNVKKDSTTRFRSEVLRVMSPARFRCAMVL